MFVVWSLTFASETHHLLTSPPFRASAVLRLCCFVPLMFRLLSEREAEGDDAPGGGFAGIGGRWGEAPLHQRFLREII